MEDVYFCRLCATQKSDSIDIYTEEGFKLKLQSKISQLLRIEVATKDPLPKIVCHDCLKKLLLFEEFIECTKQAQVTLKMLFNQVPCKVEIVETKSENGQFANLIELEANKESLEPQEYLECHISSDSFSNVQNLQIVEQVEISEEDQKPELEENKEEEKEEENFETTINLKYKEISHNVANLTANSQEIIVEATGVAPDVVIDNSSLSVEEFQVDNVIPFASIQEEDSVTIIRTNIVPADIESKESLMQSHQQENATSCQLPRKRREGWDKYPWLCTDCDEELPSMQALRQHHQAAHNQQARFMCAECRKVYTKYYGFVSHVRRHKNHMKFCCEQCGKCFSNKKVLESHRATHSDARPFVCHECGKSFRQQSALYVHHRSHQPEDVKNRFPCDQCDKRFSTKPNLVTHKRIHTGIRNFTCEQCGKSFIQKGNLDAHMLTHSADKPHTCPLCNKGFKTPLQLKKHTSVHTGAKPHQCDVCGRQFRERGTLREHHRIHTGAMPFTCEFCGKCFRFKGILTTHRRQHTGERPYSCIECQHHFTNWPNYNKHMKRRHGINTSTQPDPNKIALAAAAAAEAAVAAGITNHSNSRILVSTTTTTTTNDSNEDANSPVCPTLQLSHVYDTSSDPLELSNIEYHYNTTVPFDSASEQVVDSPNPHDESSASMLGFYNLSQLQALEPQTTIDILQHR